MLYLVEILPYTMRAKGIALFQFVTRAAGTFNTYVNPIRLKAFDWKFYFFCGAWIIVEFVVVYQRCLETMGTSLEDVALIIEGDKATVSQVNPIAEVMKGKDGTTVGHVEKVE